MKKILLSLSLVLAACTTTPASRQAASESGAVPVHRYLAWLEGDYQNGYEPSREVAAQRMKRWEGEAPDMENTDEYLEYLSILDATSPREGEAKIKQYLAKKPQEKRAVFLLGVHYMRARMQELAEYFFNQLEKDQTFTWKSLLYNNLGMLALRDGNRIQAMDYFEKAVGASPRIAAPYVNLGSIYLQGRNWVEAEKVFTAAVQADGEFEDAVLGLGSAQEGAGKFAAAWDTYKNYIDRNPGAVSTLYNASLVLGNRLGKTAEAESLMQRYIQRGGKETAGAQKMIEIWR
jgi:Tfp pilus assembly protein PilF